MFARIIAAILWLEKRLEPLIKHPLGRAGLFVFFVVMGMTSAHTAHAEDTGAGPDITEKVLMFIAGLALAVAVMLSKLVVMVIQVMIPVMLYNNFSNNPVVDSGWAILRDTVNMFFVIILIAIAFGTIFNAARFKWQQTMTRLMIFAIVINFSRTLCGLMIDLGQVVMLTFANAIREIAAGNFVQMLGMGEIYSLSTASKVTTGSTAAAPKAFDYFASAIASVFMMFFVLTIMIMLVVVLLYRVVMLWVLITVSPLAWFIGGAGDIIKSQAYAEWWAQFKCLVVVGPILTFFLWLTLVVAGSGSVGTATGFDTSGTTDPAGGFLSTIFELPNLISFIVSAALLWSGLKAAATSCTVMPGIGNPGAMVRAGATTMANATAGLGAKVGAKGLRVAGTGVGKVGGMALAKTGMEGKFSQLKEGGFKRAAGIAGAVGWEGGQIRAMKGAEGVRSGRAADVMKAGEQFAGLSGDDKDNLLKKRISGNDFDKKGTDALAMEMMRDPKRLAKNQADGTAQELLTPDRMKRLEETAKGDKGMQATLESYKKSNPQDGGDWGDIKSAADVAGLSAFALTSKGAKEHLSGIDTKKKRTPEDLAKARKLDPKASEFYSAAEVIEKGQGSFGKGGENEDKAKAFTQGPSAIYEGMKPEQLAKISPELIAKNLSIGLMDKPLGSKEGPSVISTLMKSKDPSIQEALRARLSDPGTDPKMRDSLLGHMGVGTDGKVNAAKLTGTLGTNISLLPDIMSRVTDVGERDKIADILKNPGVFDSAMASVKRNPGSEESKKMRSGLEGVFASAAPGKMGAMQANFNTQMAAVDLQERRSAYTAKIASIKSNPDSLEANQTRDELESSFASAEPGDLESAERKKDYEAQMAAMEIRQARIGKLKEAAGQLGGAAKAGAGRAINATVDVSKQFGKDIKEGVTDTVTLVGNVVGPSADNKARIIDATTKVVDVAKAGASKVSGAASAAGSLASRAATGAGNLAGRATDVALNTTVSATGAIKRKAEGSSGYNERTYVAGDVHAEIDKQGKTPRQIYLEEKAISDEIAERERIAAKAQADADAIALADANAAAKAQADADAAAKLARVPRPKNRSTPI